MALSAGTRLGAYEILAPIGADGMGEVSQESPTVLAEAAGIAVRAGFPGDASLITLAVT
ncbi:MAG: hypothetical protein ACC655_08395 [Rhodothermia bacterium]